MATAAATVNLTTAATAGIAKAEVALLPAPWGEGARASWGKTRLSSYTLVEHDTRSGANTRKFAPRNATHTQLTMGGPAEKQPGFGGALFRRCRSFAWSAKMESSAWRWVPSGIVAVVVVGVIALALVSSTYKTGVCVVAVLQPQTPQVRRAHGAQHGDCCCYWQLDHSCHNWYP